MKINYGKILDERIASLDSAGIRPGLLLHSCCGPCSSYVLEYLNRFFDITVFFSNPNIFPAEEFDRRTDTQRKLLNEMFDGRIGMIVDDYDHDAFLRAASGLEDQPEGADRCSECFRMRLERTAQAALEGGFDLFTTTLSVSPHKDAGLINRIGFEIAERYGVEYLCADFKKHDGYKRSVELSRQYGLYRQNYCGCEFSMRNN